MTPSRLSIGTIGMLASLLSLSRDLLQSALAPQDGKCIGDRLPGHIMLNEDDPRAVSVRRPHVEEQGRMKHILHGMKDERRPRPFGNADDALEAEQARPFQCPDLLDPAVEIRPAYRFVNGQCQ